MQMFRMVPIEKDLYEGTLHLDLPFILDAAAHLTHALTKLHDHGLAHGEVSDATVFVEAKACRSAPMQSWRLGEDAAVSLATLGLGVSTGGAAVPVDAMIEQRPDYLLFFAPERFADELLQPGATGPGDVWCIGVLLCYMLRRSLPLPSFQPMVCCPASCSADGSRPSLLDFNRFRAS
jgi:serine/threonine protein kinase